ncbi:MAG: tetratricopeptide repeat protein, partial [Promethearchaeota archaeon]
MSEMSQKETLKRIDKIFKHVEEEEREYNWNNAIKLLEKAKKIIINSNLTEVKAEVYYKLGEIYQITAEFEKTENTILEHFHLSILNFQKAHNIFKDLKMEGKINASKGFINFLNYIISSGEEEEQDLLKLAKECFNKASLIFLKKGDSVDSLKMKILESRALDLIIGEKLIRIDEHTNFIELTVEYEDLIKRIWDEIKKQPIISENYIYQFFISIMDFSNWIITYLPVEIFNIKKFINYIQDKIKEIINFFESSRKIAGLFYAYAIYSYLNLLFVVHFINSQSEQKKYLNIAQKWLQKGENLLPKINGNASLAVFYYTRYTSAFFLISLGYFTKEFKKILEDFDLCIDSISLCFPKIAIAHMTFYGAFSFIVGALNRSIPNMQRIDFTKKALNLIESLREVSVVKDRNYKIFNFTKDIYLCAVNAILGDAIKENKENIRYLEASFEIFDRISDYRNPKIENTYFYYHGFLWTASRTGILLAKNSSNLLKKVDLYLKAIDFLFESKKMIVAITQIENLFLIGNSYYKVGILTNDDKILNKSYLSYIDAIDYCKNKGYFNLLGSAYVNLAQIDDRLGNFSSAALNYKKAIDSFDKAILTLTYTNLGKKIEKIKNYVQAWNIIEIAKSYHKNEDHSNAQLNYEQASKILSSLHEYKYESHFYSAWAMLEKAENLSKQNKHQEAAATYLVSRNKFQEAIENLKINLNKRKSSKEKERISKLIQVTELRANYCSARYQIETARLESKRGNHTLAAELYNKASSIFENLCQVFKIQYEKQELMAIYYLCKAWEHMEQANLEQRSSSYAIASNLFEKACNNFPETRMKKLSLGNSLYCSALEFGSLFDKTPNLEEKINYYKKIKMFLREA